MTDKKLYRSCKDRILGGVAGGLGEYFDIDATLIRLVFALIFLSGFGFVAYLLAWIIIPLDPSCGKSKTGAEEISDQAEKVANGIRDAVKKDPRDAGRLKNDLRFWLGLVIIFFAFSILIQNLFGFAIWHNFWPIILIAFGIIFIASSIEKK